MIKTIIFDFGDVLVRDTTKPLEEEYKYDRMTPQQKRRYNEAFHLCETGKIPCRELFRRIHETMARQLSAKQVEQYLLDHAEVLPPWHLAKMLSKRYRIIIYSNNFRTWPQKMSRKLGIDIKAFPFVNSALLGMRKPDEKFYRYILKRFHLDPKQTVFVDDRRANLVPAKHLGFYTFLYTHNIGELKKFLKGLGVK